jgi:hypothetical protein
MHVDMGGASRSRLVEIGENIVSQARYSRRGQVVRPKLDELLYKPQLAIGK